MKQLAQRVAASFHLSVMDVDMVRGYIRHRLEAAGGTGAEFTDEACDLVHAETGGVPRLINQLCDFSMLYGWSGEISVIDAATVQQVIDDGVFFADVGDKKEASNG